MCLHPLQLFLDVTSCGKSPDLTGMWFLSAGAMSILLCSPWYLPQITVQTSDMRISIFRLRKHESYLLNPSPVSTVRCAGPVGDCPCPHVSDIRTSKTTGLACHASPAGSCLLLRSLLCPFVPSTVNFLDISPHRVPACIISLPASSLERNSLFRKIYNHFSC